jgi:hypothetical protein
LNETDGVKLGDDVGNADSDGEELIDGNELTLGAEDGSLEVAKTTGNISTCT